MKETRKTARLAPTLLEKLERQCEVRRVEVRPDDAWRTYDHANRDLDHQKDALLDVIGLRLERRTAEEPLFTLQWQVAS